MDRSEKVGVRGGIRKVQGEQIYCRFKKSHKSRSEADINGRDSKGRTYLHITRSLQEHTHTCGGCANYWERRLCGRAGAQKVISESFYSEGKRGLRGKNSRGNERGRERT